MSENETKACPEWCGAGPVKPTRVEVGQRWRDSRCGDYTVTGKSGDVWLCCFGTSSIVYRYSSTCILRDTYLGTSPEVKPAEEAKPWKCQDWCGTEIVPGPDCNRQLWRKGMRWCSEECSEDLSRRDGASPPKPAPPTVIRREVSCDGRNWIDYARLVDADPFEAYRWRRTWSNDGVMMGWTIVSPSIKPAPGPALTAGDLAGAAAAALVTRDGR